MDHTGGATEVHASRTFSNDHGTPLTYTPAAAPLTRNTLASQQPRETNLSPHGSPRILGLPTIRGAVRAVTHGEDSVVGGCAAPEMHDIAGIQQDTPWHRTMTAEVNAVVPDCDGYWSKPTVQLDAKPVPLVPT